MNKTKQNLRWGYTTGTCGAAASLAAALMFLGEERCERVRLKTPGGTWLDLDIAEVSRFGGGVSCAVKKDGGDDPDVTNGSLIYSRIQALDEAEWRPDPEECAYRYEEGEFGLMLCAGAGVGIVTRPGLSCPPGKPAINPVPRAMIFEQVAGVCRKYGYSGKLKITLSVPGGETIAQKTFNPRMGIEGGISILGTTGLVEPMSEKALLDTIRLELRQQTAEGRRALVITPGNYGSEFLSEKMGLDLEIAVKCSNYIGETLDMAREEGVKELLLVGHGGKLIKLAAGIMNTHSYEADARMEILASWAGVLGADADQMKRIMEAVTVDQAFSVIEETPGLREAVMERVMERAARALDRRAGDELKAECVIFTNERGILGMTPGAQELTGRLLNHR